MKLYIGGCGQGQDALARSENPMVECISDFHMLVRRWLKNGEDPMEETQALIQRHPSAVVVSDEVGCGVVPIDREERHWREQVGRAQCLIAEASDQVVRVVCGIGVRIK